MKKEKKEIDTRWRIFLLLFIITICGISYSKIRKKTILQIGTEKQEFLQQQASLQELDAITIEIDGAVKYPGIYTLTEGYTLKDVIEQAGGLTPQADTEAISLDWNVFDGQKVIVPQTQETIKIEYSTFFLEQNKEPEQQENQAVPEDDDAVSLSVNINTADVQELDLLPGIGEKLAENIIAYRIENGSFQTIEEIKNVPKIGDSIFEKIKNYITTQ
ncbi:MAG TPA: helix-hairpin-helix domain-containing protein [Candidatus Coprocola pullicola]|nr:helix-hairpin-helix domain-containing protein [Candidatus Coprocola pullicola]